MTNSRQELISGLVAAQSEFREARLALAVAGDSRLPSETDMEQARLAMTSGVTGRIPSYLMRQGELRADVTVATRALEIAAIRALEEGIQVRDFLRDDGAIAAIDLENLERQHVPKEESGGFLAKLFGGCARGNNGAVHSTLAATPESAGPFFVQLG